MMNVTYYSKIAVILSPVFASPNILIDIRKYIIHLKHFWAPYVFICKNIIFLQFLFKPTLNFVFNLNFRSCMDKSKSYFIVSNTVAKLGGKQTIIYCGKIIIFVGHIQLTHRCYVIFVKITCSKMNFTFNIYIRSISWLENYFCMLRTAITTTTASFKRLAIISALNVCKLLHALLK